METAPQFIWRNLQKRLTVVAESTGKVIEYKIPVFRDVPDERCWMCGGLTQGRGMLVADRITEMFSDIHLMRWKESRSLCEGCAALQSQKPFRLYSSLITEGGVRHVARATWAEVLPNPPEPPWTACLAVSGQKHLFFKTQVNRQNSLVYVQMEDLGIRFDPAELRDLLEVVERLYTVFAKDEILNGDYSSRRVQQYGISEFERDDWYVAKYRGERLLQLAVWIARKDEEARTARLAETEARQKERRAPVSSVPEPPAQPEPVGQLSLF